MDAAPARSPRALSSRGCAVLCAAHASGRVSLLLGLAAEANADAILHVGHFEAEPGQEGPDSDLAEYIRGDRTIPIPVFVLVSHQELGDKREPSFASIPNVTIIQNEASRVLYIPSKSCAIHLLDMHSICSKVEAFYQCPDTLEAFHNATNDVMNMLFPPKPPLATSELKIFVGSVNITI
ncbi:hypothetical protein BC830DRAFT_942466 [Chytriomyces sp. MP71]|nr:hypothetical protein BC830DRAFT_942466 [Chytriomyces sp. MP71]